MKKLIEVDNAISVDVSFSDSSVTVSGVDPQEGVEFRFAVSNYKTNYLVDVISQWDLKKLIESWRNKDRETFNGYIEKLQKDDEKDQFKSEYNE